jgi:glycosyltransferase involved in cell wall biosynthesis
MTTTTQFTIGSNESGISDHAGQFAPWPSAPALSERNGEDVTMSFGILGTYPPTQCGLATFSRALVESLQSPTDIVEVVRVVDALDDSPLPAVAAQWVRSSPGGAIAAADALNRYDVAIVQHEYGIYGGRDGADVLSVVRALRVPVIVVLHTVLDAPSARQRAILEELADLAARIVIMTLTAQVRLIEHYTLDSSKIRVIPHGAADNRAEPSRLPGSQKPRILTWGLLGEGKGIEWAIEAMALLRDLRPAPQYWVVGQTHPRVLELHGERYRESLLACVRRLGLDASVHFDARYLAEPDLRRLVQQTDLVLLPYDSQNQVTSGVLIEAIAAGKPVISTDFPHARELLSSGAGLLVERQDPAAIAAALRLVLSDPHRLDVMEAEARRLAPALLWPAVAEQYRQTALDVLAATVPLADLDLASA